VEVHLIQGLDGAEALRDSAELEDRNVAQINSSLRELLAMAVHGHGQMVPILY
jgi:hypothetical protein